jgi:hypothetical protein
MQETGDGLIVTKYDIRTGVITNSDEWIFTLTLQIILARDLRFQETRTR